MMPTTTISSIRVKAVWRRLAKQRLASGVRRGERLYTFRGKLLSSFVIRASSFRRSRSRLLLQAGDDADERREESKHDRADDHRQEHDHDRFQHRGESGHSVVDLVIVDVRDL